MLYYFKVLETERKLTQNDFQINYEQRIENNEQKNAVLPDKILNLKD